MDQNPQNSPLEEDETGLAGLVVPAPSSEPDRPEAPIPPPIAPYGAPIDTLAADRAARIAEIRAEAAAKEADAIKAGKPLVERPQPSASLLAAAEEHAAAELRAASDFKVSSNPNEVLPTREEILARNQARAEAAATANQPAPPTDVMTDPQYAGKTWDEIVAIRQEAHRQRRYAKELAEKESNQQKKEEFKARILAARQPETTQHRPQPVAMAISAQTLREMEAGRKRSEEFGRARGAVVMPVRR